MSTRTFLNKAGLNSIQGRLTTIAFLFIIVTAVTMGVAGFNLTVAFESKRFHDHFGLLAKYLASNAELGVLIGNENTLKGLTENMLMVSDVLVVEVLDNSGRVIMKRAHEQLDTESSSVSAPIIASSMGIADLPFLGGNEEPELLGKVNIAYSLAGLNQLKKLLAQRFVLVSLLLAFIPAVMYWMLSRAINAPLLSLLDIAGKVSQGQMDVRAPRSSLQEINTLSRAINEMLDDLQAQRLELSKANHAMARQQVLAEVGKFSMTVAHEIKNPLAIIKGSLDVLRKGGLVQPDLRKRMMGFVDDEIERINKLIEDFLLFARPRPPSFQLMPVMVLVDSLVQRIKLMAPKIKFTLDLTEEDGERELRCDPFLLERALLNIVRNALEALPSSGPVDLTIECSGQSLIFTVTDKGPGIDSGELAEIFEPFFSHKAKGTGLGLAIARGAVNAHGGQIEAQNLEQGGASFALSLPIFTSTTEGLAQSRQEPRSDCALEGKK